MDFFSKAKAALAPGMFVRNDCDVPILFVLSQLTPLHWEKVMPGATVKVECGRVWFTVSTEGYTEEGEPSKAGVAAKIAAITTMTVLTGGFLGIAVVGGVTGILASKGTKMDGVFADGKTMVVGKGETGNFIFTAVIPAGSQTATATGTGAAAVAEPVVDDAVK